MSVAYWAKAIPKRRSLLFPKLNNPIKSTEHFSSGMIGDKEVTPIGRSWKAEELRLKSDADLHKLWYVLLKEKIALKSDLYLCNQQTLTFHMPLRKGIQKVSTSMTRLRSVVGERATLRNNFYTFLEFYFIRKAQMAEETNLKKEDPKADKEKEEEKKEEDADTTQIVAQKKKKKVVIRGAIEDKSKKLDEVKLDNKVKEKIESKKFTVLTKREQIQVKDLTKDYKDKKEVLKSYIKNYQMLKGGEMRRVYNLVQKARAHTARDIFSKEMKAISYKLKHSKQSTDPNINRLENLA